MKRMLIIGLAIFKVTMIDTIEVRANLGLEHQFNQIELEEFKEEKEQNESSKTPSNRPNKNQIDRQISVKESIIETTRYSERDRLIQERFLLQLIPPQNQ